MLDLYRFYTIFNQVEQLNHQEYIFYALDKDEYFTTIHIKENIAIIKSQKQKIDKLIPLSCFNISQNQDLQQKIKNQLSQIKTGTISNDDFLYCNLSYDTIFIEQDTQQIIIPSFIINQLQTTPYGDVFVAGFNATLANYRGDLSSHEYVSKQIKNYQIMKQIREKNLNYNVEIPLDIEKLLKSMLNASHIQIYQIVEINLQNQCLKQNTLSGKKQFSDMDQFYQENFVKKISINENDLEIIKNFYNNTLILKEDQKKEINGNCKEIQRYKFNNQKGLRIPATKFKFPQDFLNNEQEVNNKNEHQQYGIDNEQVALDIYKQKNQNKYKLKTCEILYDEQLPFLCGKPDSLVYDFNNKLIGIVEVKCISSQKDINHDQLLQQLSYIGCDQEKYYLKEEHDLGYYEQIQGYLLITGLNWCDLIIYNDKGITTIKVQRNDEFINNMRKTLTQFYFQQCIKKFCNLEKKIILDLDYEQIYECVFT